ncbi:MAG: hypothetical protein SGPRY_014711, partial [Prymnesium sp.]
DMELAFVHDLRGLFLVADRRFSIHTSRICTAAGEVLRTIRTSDGSSCMADSLQCIWDGSVVYAAQKEDLLCGPPTETRRRVRLWR